jgi:hypothetical protein
MGENSITREMFRVAEPSPWKPWLIASVAAIAILGIAIGLMVVIGLFDIPKDDTGAKTLAAALALIGSVLSAAVTLVGTVVKYSIDDRNARLATIEAGRNYTLALEAEKRNRIEAAIRAVDLLSENNKDSTPNQIGGALLALVSLGELDLAVTLLAQLWPAGLGSPLVAGNILQQALETGSERTQVSAGTVLSQNAERIQHEGFHIWPIPRLGWRTDLPGNCRLSLVLAAAKWMKTQIAENPKAVPDAAVVLNQALDDPDASFADIAASSLKPLVQALPKTYWAYSGDTGVSIEQIAERLARFPDVPKTNAGVMFKSEIQKLLTRVPGEPIPKASNDNTEE